MFYGGRQRWHGSTHHALILLLGSEKKRAAQETKDCEMELHSKRAQELQQLSDNQRQDIQSLEESKRSAQRSSKTRTTSSRQNELELASAQQAACKADMAELVSGHRKDDG